MMGRKSPSFYQFKGDPDLVCPKIEGEMLKNDPCWKCPVHEECLQQFNMTFLLFGAEK